MRQYVLRCASPGHALAYIVGKPGWAFSPQLDDAKVFASVEEAAAGASDSGVEGKHLLVIVPVEVETTVKILGLA